MPESNATTPPTPSLLAVGLPRLVRLDGLIERFVSQNVRCQTCQHCVNEDLFGCYCEHPEGSAMAHGWNEKTAACECYDFKKPERASRLEMLMNAHYEAWAETYPEYA